MQCFTLSFVLMQRKDLKFYLEQQPLFVEMFKAEQLLSCGSHIFSADCVVSIGQTHLNNHLFVNLIL